MHGQSKHVYGAERGASEVRSVQNIVGAWSEFLIKWLERLLRAAPVLLRYRSHHESRACTNPPRIQLCLQQWTKLFAYTSKIVCCVTQQTRLTYATQCVPGWIAPSLKFEWVWSNFTGAEYIFGWAGAELSGAILWLWAVERGERTCQWGEEILTAQLRSHLVQIRHVRDIGFRKIV